MERNKVVEYLQIPIEDIPTNDKINYLTEYCVAKGKDADVSLQFLRLAASIGLLDTLFIEMLKMYKIEHHINIWYNAKTILQVS